MRGVEEGAGGRFAQADRECDCPGDEVLGHGDCVTGDLALDGTQAVPSFAGRSSRLSDGDALRPRATGQLELQLPVEAIDLSRGSRCWRN